MVFLYIVFSVFMKDSIEIIKNLNIMACSMVSLFLLTIYYYDNVFGNIVSALSNDNKNYKSVIFQVAIISLIFMAFFLFVFFKNLKEISKTTTKVISIIGMVVSILFIFLDVNMIQNSTRF